MQIRRIALDERDFAGMPLRNPNPALPPRSHKDVMSNAMAVLRSIQFVLFVVVFVGGGAIIIYAAVAIDAGLRGR